MVLVSVRPLPEKKIDWRIQSTKFSPNLFYFSSDANDPMGESDDRIIMEKKERVSSFTVWSSSRGEPLGTGS